MYKLAYDPTLAILYQDQPVIAELANSEQIVPLKGIGCKTTKQVLYKAILKTIADVANKQGKPCSKRQIKGIVKQVCREHTTKILPATRHGKLIIKREVQLRHPGIADQQYAAYGAKYWKRQFLAQH